jgi:hypothetical protein
MTSKDTVGRKNRDCKLSKHSSLADYSSEDKEGIDAVSL